MILKPALERQTGNMSEIIDRKEAIAYAIHHGQPGDIVVLSRKRTRGLSGNQGQKISYG